MNVEFIISMVTFEEPEATLQMFLEVLQLRIKGHRALCSSMLLRRTIQGCNHEPLSHMNSNYGVKIISEYEPNHTCSEYQESVRVPSREEQQHYKVEQPDT